MTWQGSGGGTVGGTELAGGQQQQHGGNRSATLALGRPGALRNPTAHPPPAGSGTPVTSAKCPPPCPCHPPPGPFPWGSVGEGVGTAPQRPCPAGGSAGDHGGAAGRGGAGASGCTPKMPGSRAETAPPGGWGGSRSPPDPSWGHPNVPLEELSPPGAVAAGDGAVRWGRCPMARGDSTQMGGEPPPRIGEASPRRAQTAPPGTDRQHPARCKR